MLFSNNSHKEVAHRFSGWLQKIKNKFSGELRAFSIIIEKIGMIFRLLLILRVLDIFL